MLYNDQCDKLETNVENQMHARKQTKKKRNEGDATTRGLISLNN